MTYLYEALDKGFPIYGEINAGKKTALEVKKTLEKTYSNVRLYNPTQKKLI
jgi:hypothetical protein